METSKPLYAVGIVILSALLTGCVPAALESGRDVSEDEAARYFEALSSHVPVAMKTKNFDQFCAEWSDDQAFCRESLESWRTSGAPSLVEQSLNVKFDLMTTGSQRARANVELSDGTVVSSDIEIVRITSGLRAVDPVFWVPRSIND
jgi:hypothetical protein